MSIVNRAILCAAVVSMSTACTTIETNELSQEESVSLNDKTLVISKYSLFPDFMAMTALNVQFGALGAGAAAQAGNEMIKDNQIPDPAIAIAEQLAESLSVNHNVKVMEDNWDLTRTNGLSELLRVYQGYDYILDVKTQEWRSVYYRSDWDSYRIFYIARARLIDTQSKTIIFDVECSSEPEYEEPNEGPSYDDLRNGAGLQKELNRSIEYCVDYIRAGAKLNYPTKQLEPG